MTDQVHSKVARGAIWMLLMRLCTKAIGFVSTLILARLLIPEDFGVAALAMTCIALIELIRAFGFDTSLIQNQKSTSAHYDTAFTLQLLFSLVTATILFASAEFFASFYGDPRLIPALQFLSLVVFVTGFNNVGTVQFRKDLDFGKEFKFQVLTKVIGFFFVVSIAYFEKSYWALLWGQLATRVSAVGLSYYMSSYRPTFKISKWREIMGFSSWLMLNNFLFFLNSNSAIFFIGKLSTSHSVGLYSVANEIGTLPEGELIAATNRAAFPGFSKVSHDPIALKALYIEVFSASTAIALPVAVGIAVVAPLAVAVLLGDRWLEAAPILSMLCLSGLVNGLSGTASYTYLAMGRQYILTSLTLLRLAIVLPLTYWLVAKDGAIGAAFASLLSSCILLPISQLVAKIVLGMTWQEMFNVLFRPIAAGLAMWFAVEYFERLSLFTSPFLSLVALCLAGGFVYLFLIITLWWLQGRPNSTEKRMLLMAVKSMKQLNFGKQNS